MRTILRFILAILFLPASIMAQTRTGLTVSGGESGMDYTYIDNVYTVQTGQPLTFSGITTTDRIVIAEGVTADVVLNDVNISFSDGKGDDGPAGTCAFYINNHAIVKLKITNTNNLKAEKNVPLSKSKRRRL